MTKPLAFVLDVASSSAKLAPSNPFASGSRKDSSFEPLHLLNIGKPFCTAFWFCSHKSWRTFTERTFGHFPSKAQNRRDSNKTRFSHFFFHPRRLTLKLVCHAPHWARGWLVS